MSLFLIKHIRIIKLIPLYIYLCFPLVTYGGNLIEIYPSKNGTLYIPNNGITRQGEEMDIEFVSKPKKGNRAINYSMTIDCRSKVGMLTGAELVQGKNEGISMPIGNAADEIKKIIGIFPTDQGIILGICEAFAK